MTPWLPPALAYVPDWLAYQMRQSDQPGCVIAIAHKGRVVLEQAFGHADLATGTKMTPRHRFRVASHSKSFTAASVLKLREQGRLKLDDCVGDYVENLHPDIARATISQLLSHSAGIFRDGTDAGYWSARAPFPDAARLRRDLRQAPAIDANTRFKYSNHGFALAGLVVEAVTGEPYAGWVQREIVARAGLKETSADIGKKTPLASGHSGKLPLGRRVVFPGDASTNAFAPATGFVSTAADLARYFSQLSPNARSGFLSLASRREMTRPQWRDPYSAMEVTYGLGTNSGRLGSWDWFGHAGGFQGYITRTACVPMHDLAVCVLTNASDGMAWPWLDGVLHILKTFAERGKPSRMAAGWAGRWWSVWGAVDLVPMGDKVLVASPGFWNPFLNVSELEITGRDDARIALAGGYASHGEPARRVRGKSGSVTELWLAGSRMVPEARLAKELTTRYPGRQKNGGASRHRQV
ncbi:MAG: serine hydrolase domain-containing protein [Acetobacteraceae bacterium]